MARYVGPMGDPVGPMGEVTVKGPSANVIAFRMAPSELPVPAMEKRPAAALIAIVMEVVKVPVGEVTVTVAEPGATVESICALIWPGETKNNPAGFPPIMTDTP